MSDESSDDYLDQLAGFSNLFALGFRQSHPGEYPEYDQQDSKGQEGVLVQSGRQHVRIQKGHLKNRESLET